MKTISIFSWNVNGIRAAHKKGFQSWLTEACPDILCLQEVRANNSQFNEILAKPLDYHIYWNSADKKGYGGTAIFTKKKPISICYGLGKNNIDEEGRTIIVEYKDFTLINCYFPNGNRNQDRLLFKLEFYKSFLNKCKELKLNGHKILFCGDLNTAHKEIDLAMPKNNKNKSGFLQEERMRINDIVRSGYVDSFRHFHPNLSEQYTWWSYRKNSREQNKGWRFDYVFVDKDKMNHILDAFILPEVNCSDHCPIGVYLKSPKW